VTFAAQISEDGSWPAIGATRVDHVSDLELVDWRRERHLLPEAIEGPVRGLLVCEVSMSARRAPLFPGSSKSSSGYKMLELVGCSIGAYVGRFRRIALFGEYHEPWLKSDMITAAQHIGRALAADLARRRASTHDAAPLRTVLVGQRVADAFALAYGLPASLPFVGSKIDDDHAIVPIPHPNAKWLPYKEAQTRRGASAVLRWAAGYLEHGLTAVAAPEEAPAAE